MSFLTKNDLSATEQELLNRAVDVMSFAYNPYSSFCVGAALEAMDGSIHVGTNIENATYNNTIHAEMAALAAANTLGVRTFKTVVSIGHPHGGISDEPVMPCGLCRQNLYEFAQLGSGDMIVIGSNTQQDKIIRTSLSQLFPHAFGPKDVGVNLTNFQ
jgi:cytidine deaminase